MSEQSLLREKENRENLLIVKGKSSEPKLRIGGRAKLSDINDKAMETYRVLAITHYHNGNEYYNEFVGIPDVFQPPYQDNFALPRAEEQVAKVMDNADPKGMGRVRVQMRWQEKSNQKTPWIRMLQPHAGGGKGFYFVPELGEEVLVGFEGRNAEKPYIIGMHYNGKEKSGYHTAGNDKKVIHTRSGTKIILNDAEGSVFIEDPSGNTYLMDGQGNINITASHNVFTSAGMSIMETAGVNHSSMAGGAMTQSAGLDYSLMAANITEIARGARSSTAREIQEISKNTINNSENDIIFNAKNNIHHKSGENSKIG